MLTDVRGSVQIQIDECELRGLALRYLKRRLPLGYDLFRIEDGRLIGITYPRLGINFERAIDLGIATAEQILFVSTIKEIEK